MLDWPEEYFTSLSGTTYFEGSHDSYWITSLSFETNKRKYGPYGPKVTSNTFEFPLKGRVLVGFYGRAYPDSYVRGGLGVYVRQSSDFCVPSTSLSLSRKLQVYD